MKKLIKQLTVVNSNLKELRQLEIDTPNSAYYKKFNRVIEMDLDMEIIRQQIRDALKDKYTILENIKSEAVKAMVDVSYEERQEILKKPHQWNPANTN